MNRRRVTPPDIPPPDPVRFAELLAAAMEDVREVERTRSIFYAAQNRARLTFQACLAEYGKPRAHSVESDSFWRRWNRAERRARAEVAMDLQAEATVTP